jgi:hypothetical protein
MVSLPAAIDGMCAARCAADAVGLERQHSAQRLHHDQRVHRATAETAIGLGERQAQQAELGVLRPERCAVAGGFGQMRMALLEAAAIGEQSRHAVLQHELLFGEIEVHQCPPGRHGPRRGPLSWTMGAERPRGGQRTK